MTRVFGQFRLDEPKRLLTLADREVALQPRVFDLLTYLARHSERVVTKDELLDALWPNINVTENSLQRLVSLLRGILRDGGADAALKTYAGKGYRLAIDADEPREADTVLAVSEGHERHLLAFAEQRWSDVISFYAIADTHRSLSAEELEQWGYALQCRGKPSDAVPIFVRAIAAYTQTSHSSAAAAIAVDLSTIHMERNEIAVAKGWAATAEDLLSSAQDAVEFGYVLWMQAKLAAYDGDVARAKDLADAAYNFGQRKGSAEIEALGLVYRGFYRAALGETAEGFADQDRAAALALSHNVGPVAGSVLYCNILWACRSFGDWARASQWTLGYRHFCSSSRMEFSGSCQLHHAEVLGVQGSLHDALGHIQDAIARLADDAPWALGDAYRVLGDVHAAIGNEAEAIAAYDRCYATGWSPEPGYAMLLLERGDGEAAYARLEQSLNGTNWWDLQRRGLLLAYRALIAAHIGRAEDAAKLITEVSVHEQRWPMPAIRALAAEASAALAASSGKPSKALRLLHLARQLWTSVGSRFNAARVRIGVAALCVELGDQHAAAVEHRAALMEAEQLGSNSLVRKCSVVAARTPNSYSRSG